MQHYIRFRPLAYCAALLAGASPAYAYTLEPQQAGTIAYVTGGIGDEDRDALKAVQNNYNLSILNATPTGEFVGNTHVVILDKSGTSLLDTTAGPLFYAQLPPGRYIIASDRQGQSHRQTVVIAKHKPAHVHVSWK